MTELTTKQAAERVGLSLDTIRQYTSRGKLRPTRKDESGRMWFDVEDLDRWSRERRPAHRPRKLTLDEQMWMTTRAALDELLKILDWKITDDDPHREVKREVQAEAERILEAYIARAA